MLGVVVGMAVAVALVATGTLRLPPHREEANAQPEFLDAWARSRQGTFVVTSDFRRTIADGSTLYSATELVQRPPDRLVRQFGGISGKLGGHPIVCSTDPTGNYRCFPGSDDLPPYDQQVAKELDTFRSWFAGERPLYKVVKADAGCFEFFLQVPYPDPDYGQYAKLCFDGPTGALRLIERHLANDVVETTEAVDIRTRVDDADFSTEPDPEFDLRMDLGDVPVVGPDATPGPTPGVNEAPTGTAPVTGAATPPATGPR